MKDHDEILELIKNYCSSIRTSADVIKRNATNEGLAVNSIKSFLDQIRTCLIILKEKKENEDI